MVSAVSNARMYCILIREADTPLHNSIDSIGYTRIIARRRLSYSSHISIWNYDGGLFASQHVGEITKIAKKPGVIMAASIPVGRLSYMSVNDVQVRYSAEYAPWVIVSLLFFIGITVALPTKSMGARALAFVGGNSIVYYTLHWPILFAVYHLTLWRFPEWHTVIIAFAMTVALAGATLAALAAKKTPDIIFTI